MRSITILMFGQALGLAGLAALGALAQDPPQRVEATRQFTAAELDQLAAPIALYPDPLLGQILMAATYPLEVVEADRWLQDPGNAALKDDRLAAALEQRNWEPSVKSLVAFPQILAMMDANLDWTERIGEAFAADQAAVMDSVQRLRRRAESAGRLQSTPEETVTALGPAITIEPPTPETVYIPVYDPSIVYDPWPYPDYPPDYFPGLVGGFGTVIAPFRGLHHCDWEHHRIDIDRDRWARLNGGRPPLLGSRGGWEHDPSRRSEAVHWEVRPHTMTSTPLQRAPVVVIRPQVAPQYKPQAAMPHMQPTSHVPEPRPQPDRGMAGRLPTPLHAPVPQAKPLPVAPVGGGR